MWLSLCSHTINQNIYLTVNRVPLSLKNTQSINYVQPPGVRESEHIHSTIQREDLHRIIYSAPNTALGQWHHPLECFFHHYNGVNDVIHLIVV